MGYFRVSATAGVAMKLDELISGSLAFIQLSSISSSACVTFLVAVTIDFVRGPA